MPVRMHRMFDGHDARWKKGKPLMKRFFDVPFNRAMSDAEYMECQAFVIGTMNGCDWPTDNFTDHISFKEMIEKSHVGTSELGLNMPWRVLKSKFDNDRLWPVFPCLRSATESATWRSFKRVCARPSGPSSHRTLFGRFPKPCDSL